MRLPDVAEDAGTVQKGTSILLIGSDYDLSGTFAGILRSSGFLVTVAAEVRRAIIELETWSAAPKELVLVDHGTFGAQALQLAGAFRHMSPVPRVIVVTSHPETILSLDALALGVPVIPKPNTTGQFTALVRYLNPYDARVEAANDPHRASIATAPERASPLASLTRSRQFSAGEIKILECLARQRGEWCTTEAMARDCFNRRDDRGRYLVWRYISNLRRKLQHMNIAIEHSARLGYRLGF